MDVPQTGTHPHLPLESLLSCDESTDRFLHDVKLTIGQSEDELGSALALRVQVQRIKTEEQWEISRKYEDCEWLFKSLKNKFPGTLLPYFPAPSVQQYLQEKAKILNLKLHKHFYAPRLQQLAHFLSIVCSHPRWGVADQVQIFLLKGEDFQRRKEQLGRVEEQARLSSKTFSIYSFLSRSLSWLSAKQQEKADPGNQFLRLRYQLNTYSTQLAFLLQKLSESITLKTAEMEWRGSSTEIDSVERLKAKILSSKPFTQRLVSEIEGKVMIPLVQALKREAQIHQQIEDRAEAGKLFEYLKSSGETEHKIQKFASHIHQFDKSMLQEWIGFEQDWKEAVGELDNRLRAIWTDYSQSMAKIWK